MAESVIQPIPIPVGIEIPTNLINSKITVSKRYLRKYGRIAEINLEGTANANIESWAQLVTGLPVGYKPYQSNNAYTINIDYDAYMCNMNAEGVVNTVYPINSGQIIRFHAVYFVE